MNLKEQLAAEIKAATELYKTAQAEQRDMSEAEAKAFDEHCAKADELKTTIAKLADNTKKLTDLMIHDEVVDIDDDEPTDAKSLSERYIAGAAYKGYRKLVERGLEPHDIHLSKSRIASLKEFYGAKAGNALTDSLVHAQAERLATVDLVNRPPVTLLDVITRGSISSESVEYLQITSVTRNTAIVPENTGDDAADTQKPQSTFGTNLETASVYDYAGVHCHEQDAARQSGARHLPRHRIPLQLRFEARGRAAQRVRHERRAEGPAQHHRRAGR